MADKSVVPRIPPFRPEELTTEQRELVGGDGPQLNIFLTLARYPGLLRKWLPFGGKLLAGGKLAPRDRELIILRTAFRCGAGTSGRSTSRSRASPGSRPTRSAGSRTGPGRATGWSDADATLLRAVDELHDDHCVGESNLERARESLRNRAAHRDHRCSPATTRCSPAR